MRQLLWIGFAMFVVMASSSAVASASVTVDGSLGDWGVTIDGGHLIYSGYGGAAYSGNGSANVSYEGTATIDGRRVAYHIEDSNDNAGENYLLGPLYGGQNYDAEALLVSLDGGHLQIAIATGQRPDNGATRFSPGDISIVKGDTIWGIEVGGGGAAGTTYTLKTNGYTASHTHDSAKPAGSIWMTEESDWIPGISGSGDPRAKLKANLDPPDKLGLATYAFESPSYPFQHAFIELDIADYASLFRPSGPGRCDDPVGALVRQRPTDALGDAS